MRDRLIELLKSPHKAEQLRQMGVTIGKYEDDCVEAMIGDFLLANGVTIRERGEWISVEERLPEPETKVLVLAIRKFLTKEGLEIPVITTAMYEDGTISTDDSCWGWDDIPFIYDEENDIQYIPEGWWEYSEYTDECGAIADKVTHWMPLPKPPSGADMRGEENETV